MPEQRTAVLLRDILQQLESIEGQSFYRDARYYSSTADLELLRYRMAKRLLRTSELVREQYLAKLKMFRDSGGSMGCCHCNCSFTSLGPDVEIIGDRLIHAGCRTEWDAFLDARVEITHSGREALASDLAADGEAAVQCRSIAAGER